MQQEVIGKVRERAEWCAEGRRTEREGELRGGELSGGEVEDCRFELEDLAISSITDVGLLYDLIC